jgi:hypothetical protein
METSTAIYFFSDQGPYGYMSNFYVSPFQDPKTGVTFPTSEHYFMYYKCLHFDADNQEVLNAIANAPTPSKVKQLGRQVQNYNDEEWNRVRYDVMKDALLLKFSQNEIIRGRLLKDHRLLIEASPYDRIWGIGYGPSQAPSVSPEFYGQNLLGKCLMEVRELLLNKTSTST